MRIAELRFGQAEPPVLLLESRPLLLLRLHFVSVFNGTEVLPAVKHHERKQNHHRRSEDTHLAHTNRIGRLHQTGVVQSLAAKDLRRGSSPGTLPSCK